jgi:hypothetical protein
MRTTKTQSSFHPSDRKEAKPLAVRNLNTAHDFNVPVSQLKFRCEKENTLPTNFDPVSIVFVLGDLLGGLNERRRISNAKRIREKEKAGGIPAKGHGKFKKDIVKAERTKTKNARNKSTFKIVSLTPTRNI